MPLEGHAQEMVSAADRHGIDWRLLPVIAYLESQGGLTACGGNAWGYANCEVRFASFEEAWRQPPQSSQGTEPHPREALHLGGGDGCTTTHAVDYVYRAAGSITGSAGRWRAAYPAQEAVAADVASDATTPGPAETATATPEATPSATESTSPEPTPTVGTPTPTESPVEGTPTLVPISGE
jgi:hypothetical protein